MPKKIISKPAVRNGLVPVTEIESLDQLQEILDVPIYCDFRLDGKNIRIKCRRVSQQLDSQVRALQREVQPKYNPSTKDYEYTDPGYLANLDHNKRVARSLVVYSGCPVIAAKKPGLTNTVEIHKFVSQLLTENIIELIFLRIQAGGMELADSANFTSTPALES